MHDLFKTSYLLPAILLNPVLFLHSLNTILSRILPPIVTSTGVQPPPYSGLGPSATQPHLNVHSSEQFCWSYTIVMVCAQLMAFGNVSLRREEGRERTRVQKKVSACIQEETNGEFIHEKENENLANGHSVYTNGVKDIKNRSTTYEDRDAYFS